MNELQCYNRGCGMKFKSEDNSAESCRHHPGEPVFHDAYKGWSCCNKKCTDFTEFLNIRGCTLSKHSDVKPPEPEKHVASTVPDVLEIKPIVKAQMVRPPLGTPMVTMKPEIPQTLKERLIAAPLVSEQAFLVEDGGVSVGTSCKNGGCNVTYNGPQSDSIPCVYHPGSPVFHEGLKFWSCCLKRTSDFNAFLNQIGCENGTHLWTKKGDKGECIQCRWDFHQTVTHVIVSIYAKHYCPIKSEIQLNPVQLSAKLIFPLQNDAAFSMKHELCGVIDVVNSQVTMYGTKVEIKMKKAEPGTWTSLEIVKKTQANNDQSQQRTEQTLESKVESVDLSAL